MLASCEVTQGVGSTLATCPMLLRGIWVRSRKAGFLCWSWRLAHVWLQLAGEAAVPYGAVGCCEVDKHSSGLLFSWKAILDVLCQQGDLIYGQPPVSEARLRLWEQCVGDCFDTSVDESLEDFKGDTQQRYRAIALRVPQWLLWLRIATTSALLQIFGILSWRMQELRKSQNQDLRADPAWSINSGKMESNPGDFPGFKRLREEANSSGLKGLEIVWPSGVGIFHRSDSCLLTSLVD